MKSKTVKVFSAVCCIIFFTVMFNSCKKTDQTVSQPTDLTKDALVEKINEALKKNPAMGQVTIPVNQKVQGYWADLNGREIKNDPSNNSARTYQCASVADVDFPPTSNFVNMTFIFDCTEGWKFTSTWTVSISVNLVATSPFGGALSKGRIKVKNAAGAVIYSELAGVTPVSITLLGDDANAPGNGWFQVVCTSLWIPKIYFPATASTDAFGGSTVFSSISMNTDCADLPLYATPYSSGITFPNGPLGRVDPVYYTPASLSGNAVLTPGILLGYKNSTCQYPPSLVTYPDRQSVEIKYTGGGGWKVISPVLATGSQSPNTTYGTLKPFTDGVTPSGSANQTGSIGLYDAYYIPNRDLYLSGSTTMHGNYLIRFRNEMTANGPGAVGTYGPYSAEIPIVL